jgi:Mrp family chromosome partitioning ATPase
VNKPTGPIDGKPTDSRSIFERATQVYDFGDALRGHVAPPIAPGVELGRPDFSMVPDKPEQVAEAIGPASRPRAQWTGPVHALDRVALAEAGFLLPDGPVTAIGEEFRIVKRALLSALDMAGETGARVLVCSALPGEGKTFCSVNLALSLAAEKDIEVLLVDADVASPAILSTLGLEGGPGFLDALADLMLAVEDCVLRTDIPSLAVLPAGRQSNNDTEYLASARMGALLGRLSAPGRLILLDSPPLLAASPASAIAQHVDMALMVVRADRTTECALRDAAGLLKACPKVQLMLNGVQFSASGRRFGTYYGTAQ